MDYEMMRRIRGKERRFQQDNDSKHTAKINQHLLLLFLLLLLLVVVVVVVIIVIVVEVESTQ